MKYLKKSFEYVNSKFWYLILMSVVPAFMLCSRYSPSRIIDFLIHFKYNDFSSFSAVYNSLTYFGGSKWWLVIPGLIIMCASVSIISGAIDRHMRIGVFTVDPKLVAMRLNFNYIATLKGLLLYVAIFELNYLLASVFIFWFGVAFTPTVAVILSILVLAIMVCMIIVAFSLVILWTPTIIHTGLPAYKALAMSVRQSSRELWRICLALLMPALPIGAAMIISSSLNLPLEIFFDALFFAVMVVYHSILSHTIFYEVNGLERMDLVNAKKDIWKKSRSI